MIIRIAMEYMLSEVNALYHICYKVRPMVCHKMSVAVTLKYLYLKENYFHFDAQNLKCTLYKYIVLMAVNKPVLFMSVVSICASD